MRLPETVGKSYYKVFDPATSSTFNTKHAIFKEEAFSAKHSQVEDDGAFEVAGDGDHIEGGYESENCSSTSSATLNDASEVIPSIEEQEGQPSGSPPQNPPLDQNEPRQEDVEADVEERDHEASEGTIENEIKASDVTGDRERVRRCPRGTENLLIHPGGHIKRMEVPAIRELNLMKKSSCAIIKRKRKMTLRL